MSRRGKDRKTEQRIRTFEEKALQARRAGRHEAALALYLELGEIDPDEPRWLHQAGELARKLKSEGDAVALLVRAASGYLERGFSIKALALCKVILSLDPEHEGARALLDRMGRQVEVPSVPWSPSPGTPQVPWGAPLRAAAAAPVDESPPSPPQELDLEVEIEAVVEPKPTPAPTPPAPPLAPPPTAAVDDAPQSTASAEDLSLEELDALLNQDEPVFMEVLEVSEDTEPEPDDITTPAAPPHLDAGAPLDALELRHVLPAKRRRTATADVGQAFFEVPLGDEELEAALSALPEPPDADVGAEPAPVAPAEDSSRVSSSSLPETELFTSLEPEALHALVSHMALITTTPGQEIIREGEVGGALYVVVSGTFEVSREQAGRRVSLAKLGEGAFFGEAALITDSPRLADVTAVDDGQLIEISRDTVREMIEHHPQVVPILLRFCKKRLVGTFVKTSGLLGVLPAPDRSKIIREFKLYEVGRGKRLIQEGSPSRGLFIILAGRAVVTRREQDGNLQLAEIGAGDFVGEISLLSGKGAIATVTTTGKSWLLVMPQRQWDELEQRYPQFEKLRDYLQSMANARRLANDALLRGDRQARDSHSLRLV